MSSFKDLSEDNLVDIALFSGEIALIGTASWAISPKDRPIVRFVAKGIKNVKDHKDIENLLSYNISPEHWLQFRHCGAEKYAYLLANSTKWCPETIKALFSAGIINPARFFASKYTLCNLCIAFPDFVDFYRNFMIKRPDIKMATISYYKKERVHTFVINSRLIEALTVNGVAPPLMYAFDDPNCVQKWQQDCVANIAIHELHFAYDCAINTLLNFGYFKLLLSQYLTPIEIYKCLYCRFEISHLDNVDLIRNVINKFDSKISYYIEDDFVNKIRCLYKLKTKVDRITLDVSILNNVIKNGQMEALELLSELNLIGAHDIINACKNGTSNKFNNIALRLLQNMYLDDNQIKYLLVEYSMWVHLYIKNNKCCDYFINWLYNQCSSDSYEELIETLNSNNLITKYHCIVKDILREQPNLKNKINFGNYDPKELIKYSIVTNDEYILEKLKKCSAAEFEAHFDKWSIEGREKHIRTVFKYSPLQKDKMNLICNTPKFANIIDSSGWHNLLSRVQYKNEQIVPLQIDLIFLAISNLKILNTNQVPYSAVDINLIYAIYKVFKCGYGGDIARKQLLDFIPNIAPHEIINNLESKFIAASYAAIGFIERGHTYEDYGETMQDSIKINLAALVAHSRMPATVQKYEQLFTGATNFFISLIDPQFGNLY